jgi:hypothetical protein
LDSLRHLKVLTRQKELVRNQKKKGYGKGEEREEPLSPDICQMMLQKEKDKFRCYIRGWSEKFLA